MLIPRRLVAAIIACAALTCFAPTASAQDVDALWSAYDERDAEYETLREQAEALPSDTTQGDRAYREAAEAAGALADVIEQLLMADDSLAPDEVERAIDRLLTVRQVQGSFLADVGACEEAAVVLDSVMNHPGIDDRALLRERTAVRLEQAQACAAGDEFVGVTDPEPDPVMTDSGGTRGAGFALLGTGGALLAGGLGWDLAVAGDVSDFESMRDDCDAGASNCDPGLLDDLSGNIETAKLGTGLLYGLGAVSAITGVVLVAIDGPDERPREARLSPWIGRHGIGVRADVTF